MRAYVGIGTNLGDRWAHLALAGRLLAAAPRTAATPAAATLNAGAPSLDAAVRLGPFSSAAPPALPPVKDLTAGNGPIGIRDARAPAPGIGTGVKGDKVEPELKPAAPDAAPADVVMMRLVPVLTPASQLNAAKGVMAYAAQAAAKAAAKDAVSLAAALIEVA